MCALNLQYTVQSMSLNYIQYILICLPLNSVIFILITAKRNPYKNWRPQCLIEPCNLEPLHWGWGVGG